jgi:hypothetical protein
MIESTRKERTSLKRIVRGLRKQRADDAMFRAIFRVAVVRILQHHGRDAMLVTSLREHAWLFDAATDPIDLDVASLPCSAAAVWADDTVLGIIFQAWNDPEREALDAKILSGGKIAPRDITSKTQLFTDRYMVEWLLHNSLGLTWLCICKKNGWRADAEDILPVLDARRAEWRAKRDAGEVALEALMPIAAGLEDAWKYYVPQPIPDDGAEKAPASIRELKLLDPACGTGNFLTSAFDSLVMLHEEEARHRGETWTREEIARCVVERNLHGVDIDRRVIKLASIGLSLKAEFYAPGVRLGAMNLFAPKWRENAAAIAELVARLDLAGVPGTVTKAALANLRQIDHLGTLLRIDHEIRALVDAALPVARVGLEEDLTLRIAALIEAA